MSNVHSGMGYERDNALRTAGRGVLRQNLKTFNTGVKQERVLLPLDPSIPHVELLVGDLVSLKNGKVVPLTQGLPFAGIIGAIGEDHRGVYTASLCIRGAVAVRVMGLAHDTPLRQAVHVLPGGPEVFTLDATGVPFGELLAIESLERGLGIIGFKLADDARPLRLLGGRASGDGLPA